MNNGSLMCQCHAKVVWQSKNDSPVSAPQLDTKLRTYEYDREAKGQVTSKGLFGILGFFQKTNEQIRF